MLVAACMRRLPQSMARKGPQANEPSLNASAVPKNTGTAAAVRLKGLARRNHSSKTCRLLGFIVRPIVERVVHVCNRSVHGFQASAVRQVGSWPIHGFLSRSSLQCIGDTGRRGNVALSTDRSLLPNLKPVAYCGTNGSRGSRQFQWTRELLSAAGQAQAVDQERVRAGRGGLRGEGFLGDRDGPRAASFCDLLCPLRGRLRGQRRARRRGGPQAPTQEVQTSCER